MEFYDVRRYALILAIQAEIEGMKAANSQQPDKQPYSDDDFKIKAEELRQIAYKHNDLL